MRVFIGRCFLTFCMGGGIAPEALTQQTWIVDATGGAITCWSAFA